MTTKELIDILKEYPEDLDVRYATNIGEKLVTCVNLMPKDAFGMDFGKDWVSLWSAE